MARPYHLSIAVSAFFSVAMPAAADSALRIAVTAAGTRPFRVTRVQPLPMNEFLQETLKQNCGVDVALEVVEWQVLLNAMRATPDAPSLRGATVLNISLTTSDVAVMARTFGSANLAPKGFNFAQWADARFDAAMMDAARASTPEAMDAAMRAGHERLVDDPPWLYVVHDLNPRAMSPRVKGFVPPRSWFVDLTRISVP